MTEALDLLEQLGRDPAADMAALLDAAAVPPATREALLRRDAVALAQMLGARPTMACSLALPDREEEPVPQDDEREDEAPDSEARAA